MLWRRESPSTQSDPVVSIAAVMSLVGMMSCAPLVVPYGEEGEGVEERERERGGGGGGGGG